MQMKEESHKFTIEGLIDMLSAGSTIACPCLSVRNQTFLI